METSQEIRHSPQEIKRQVVTCLVGGVLFVVLEWFNRRPYSFPFWFWAFYGITIPLGTWLWMRQKYLAADDSGVTYTNWFQTQRVAWDDVVFYSLEWKNKSNLFAFSSYDPRLTKIVLVLFDEKREALLRIVLDFGDDTERIALKNAMVERLQGSATQVVIE